MKDLQKKSEKDLQQMVTEKREELRGIRFASAGSGQRDVKVMRAAKKEIAQALTELNTRTVRDDA